MTKKKIVVIPSMKAINAKEKTFKVVSSFSGCGGSSTGVKMAGGKVLIATEFVPAAIETYKANHKGTRVIETDIREVDWKSERKELKLKRGELDLSEGSPPCFPAGEMVYTIRGYAPIETVTRADLALSHKGKMRAVTGIMGRAYRGKLVTIKSYLGEMRATPEHPIYVRKNAGGKITRDLGKARWVDAGKVTEDHYVGIPYTYEEANFNWRGVDKLFYHRGTGEYVAFGNSNTLPVEQSEFWWIVGRWLGDGWNRFHENVAGIGAGRKKPRHGVVICCDKSDGGKELAEIVKRAEACGLKYRISERRTVYRVGFPGKEISTFFTMFGKGAGNKTIPDGVMRLPKPLLKSVLIGYISADGHILNRDTMHVRYSSVSPALAYGIAMVVARVYRVPTNVTKRAQHPTAGVIEGRKVNLRPIYVGEFRLRPDRSKVFWERDDKHIWVPISKIEVEKYRGPVFNFSVRKEETYVVSNMAVHNCKSFSIAGTKSGGWGEVKKYSGNIHQRTDDLFYEEMRKIEEFAPKVFVCENVKGMVEGDSKGYFIEIIRDLKALGYAVKAQVLNGAYLDVPQARERVIIVGVRNDLVKKGFQPIFPKPLPYVVTVRDVLPHIYYLKSKKKGELKYVPADIPSPTIVASDGLNSETAGFSTGGFIETSTGERRKYTIDELKKIFTFPEDFIFTGKYEQQFERLGRSVPPMMMKHVVDTIHREILLKL